MLPEPAYSLSRYALDHLLLREAILRGAELRVEAAKPGEAHQAACRRVLGRQYSVASLLRQLLGAGLAEKLAAFVPGRMLYRMTRPAV